MESVVNQGNPIKDTAEFKTYVNNYSLSQSNVSVGNGIAADAQPKPEPQIKDENVNQYSLKKCGESFDSGQSDNLNDYSLSKLGKGLS